MKTPVPIWYGSFLCKKKASGNPEALRLGLFCGFVVCLDRGCDFSVIVQEVNAHSAGYEDAGNQSSSLDTLAGGSTGTVGTLAQKGRAGDDHDGLAKLIGEVSGCQEHTGPVLTGLDGVILSKIGEHGCGNDVGNGDGHGDAEADNQREALAADYGGNKPWN